MPYPWASDELITATKLNTMQELAGIAAEGTQVFNAIITASGVHQDLDLSAVVGANYAFVFLSVKSPGGVEVVDIRQNGSSIVLDAQAAVSHVSIDAGDSAYMIVVTDTNGIIEITSTPASQIVNIKVVGWVALS